MHLPTETLTDIVRLTVYPPAAELSFFEWPGTCAPFVEPYVAARGANQRQIADAMLVCRRFRDIVITLLREQVVLSTSSDAMALFLDKKRARVVKHIFIEPPGPSWTVLCGIAAACPNLSGFHDADKTSYGGSFHCKNIMHATVTPRFLRCMPSIWAKLCFLEIFGTRPSTHKLSEALPCLVSLKISTSDFTLYGCSMPALRNLCFAPAAPGFDSRVAGSRAVQFLLKHGVGLLQLEFTPFPAPLADSNIDLDFLCPVLSELVFDASAGIEWDDPLWELTLFSGRPRHLQVATIGLRNIEGAALSEIIGYIQQFINRDLFPALRNVRDLGYRTGRTGFLWAGVGTACAVGGVSFTDRMGNVVPGRT